MAHKTFSVTVMKHGSKIEPVAKGLNAQEAYNLVVQHTGGLTTVTAREEGGKKQAYSLARLKRAIEDGE